MLRKNIVLVGLLALFLLAGCNSGRIPCPKPVGDSTSFFSLKKNEESGILPMTKKPVERDRNGLIKKKKFNLIKRKNA